MSGKENAALRNLAVTPTPVLHAAFNFKKELMDGKSGDFKDFSREFGVPAALFAHLRPPLHFWMQDSDPVVALGTGNILGAFGGGMERMGRMSNGDMVMIPVFLSILTRPCALAVEVDDPAAVRDLLAMSVNIRNDDRSWFHTRLVKSKYPGRDAWQFDCQLENIISLHFGVELQGRYLVLTNLPWSQKFELAERPEKLLNGASLEVHPEAVEKQLPALFTAAVAQQRASAMAGLGCLTPILLAEGGDVGRALKRHMQLFGYAPLHPAGGRWVWKDGWLESDRFGTPWEPLQPEYAPGDRGFGLLREVRDLSLSMQFEDTGLRTRLTWKCAAPPAEPPRKP